MIAKVIHYCWFGKGEMSPLHKACMATWKKHLSEYEFVCWDETNSPMDIPFVRYHYERKNWAFVSDYVRLWALYQHGGFYLDVDFEVLKDLEPLRQHSVFLGEELPGRITNAICGGEASHAFFDNAIKLMAERHEKKQAILTSPEVCTAVYKKMRASNENHGIKIYEPKYFYPYNPFDTDPSKHFLLADYITEKTFAIHHWGHSWKQSLLKRILRKIKIIVQG